MLNQGEGAADSASIQYFVFESGISLTELNTLMQTRPVQLDVLRGPRIITTNSLEVIKMHNQKTLFSVTVSYRNRQGKSKYVCRSLLMEVHGTWAPASGDGSKTAWRGSSFL